jgi:hypothetical protein
MASTVYTLFNGYDMPPGATWPFEWKNIPQGKAYAVDAKPFNNSTSVRTTAVEVTRVWRRTREIEKTGTFGVEIHNDILGQIKNVGNYTASFGFSLIVFT